MPPPDWLQCAHLLYLAALFFAYRTWRGWKLEDKLIRVDPNEVDEPIRTVFPMRRSGAPSTSSSAALPFTHIHHRLSLILHILFLFLSYLAAARVQQAASLELQHSGLIKSDHQPLYSASSSSAATAALKYGAIQDSSLRHPRDASDLIPKQRGGRFTVQEIMEKDVAHLLQRQKKEEERQAASGKQRVERGEEDEEDDDLDSDEFEGTSKPSHVQPQRSSSDLPTYDPSALTDHAAPALLFHLVSLPLCLAHLLLYSPYSFLDGRLPFPVSRSFFLKPRWKTRMQATFATGWLMVVTMMATMYCLLTVKDLHPPPPHSDLTDSLGDLNPHGLLSGLLYLPFFLLGLMRWGMNAVQWWRFGEIYQQIGVSAEKVKKMREKREAKKQGPKKTSDSKKSTTATDTFSSSSSAAPVERTPKRVSVTAAQPSSTLADDGSDHSDHSEEEQEEEEERMDMEMLRELASFAPNDDSSSSSSLNAISSSSGDPVAPSSVIQKLRRTPKLLEILEKESKEKEKQQKEAGKKRQ